MMKIKLLAALAAAAIGLPALAQTQQEARIQRGVQSGQLTPKEATRLDKGQARVQKKETKAKADGKVTPKERKKLAQAQGKESKKIAREKHDKQVTAPRM